MQNQTLQQLAIPLSIIVAGALIAAAMYFGGTGTKTGGVQMLDSQELLAGEKAPVPAVTEKDWIRGNPNAKLKIVEYSDPQCGYCKRFHQTLQQIINEHAAGGEVAWVYRHLPILGPASYDQALALQCAGTVGGQTAFWDNIDAHFEAGGKAFPTSDAYTACVKDPAKRAEIEAMATAAQSLGIQGTPASFILVDGQQVSIDGAQPYEAVKKVVETLLKK